MKKAAIYDPYLDTLGGGEKYLLTIAEFLLEKGYSVDLYTDCQSDLINKAGTRFSLNIDSIQVKKDIFKTKGLLSILKKFKHSSQYDLFIYLNDGSIPFLFSKKNILHIQVPFNNQPKLIRKISNLVKLSLFKHIIVNSDFTKRRVQKNYLKNSTILYPPIDTNNFIPANQKQNIILSVGRFDNILNTKRQDIMIKSFANLYQKNNLKDWQYILIGGSVLDEHQNNYLKHLKFLAKDLPIKFLVNASFADLKKYYSESKIFWHAAGFDIDEDINPQQTEHFGMSTVEAMSAGLVPVVVNKGGLKETVSNNVNGYLWDTADDLVSKTQFLIGHPKIMAQMSLKAIESSKKFSSQSFKNQFSNIIK